MYPSRLHAAGMCMCVSCDPGQVLLLLGLFAEKLWSSGPATGDHDVLTGTARLQTVAVLLSTLQLSRFICYLVNKIASRAGSALYCFFIKAEKIGCYLTPQRAKSTRAFSFQGVHV